MNSITKEKLDINALTGEIIGAAIEVHTVLGPGLLESAYEQCLKYELGLRQLNVISQKPLPICYKNVLLDCSYRLDLVVEEQVVVEIKAVSDLNQLHEAQLFSYLKISNYKLGLLLNFNVIRLKDGIRRIKI